MQSSLLVYYRKRHWQVTPPEALSPGKEAKYAKCESTENLLHRNKALNDNQHDDDAVSRDNIN